VERNKEVIENCGEDWENISEVLENCMEDGGNNR
jgi:hypothetical protein